MANIPWCSLGFTASALGMTKESGSTLEVRLAGKLKVASRSAEIGPIAPPNTSSFKATATFPSRAIITDLSIGLALPTAFVTAKAPAIDTV